jgi:hypothetical protein
MFPLVQKNAAVAQKTVCKLAQANFFSKLHILRTVERSAGQGTESPVRIVGRDRDES